MTVRTHCNEMKSILKEYATIVLLVSTFIILYSIHQIREKQHIQ